MHTSVTWERAFMGAGLGLRCAALSALCMVASSGSVLGAAQSPAVMVRAEVQNILVILNDTSIDAKTRREKLTRRIAGRFDIRGMSRSILALRWKDATEAEKDRFVSRFSLLLEHIYVSAIEGYTTETVTVGGESIRGERASVLVTIVRERDADILLLFKLKRHGDGWLAYDANVEGLSLVRHYREEFDYIATQRGMAGVLERLDELVEGSRS